MENSPSDTPFVRGDLVEYQDEDHTDKGLWCAGVVLAVYPATDGRPELYYVQPPAGFLMPALWHEARELRSPVCPNPLIGLDPLIAYDHTYNVVITGDVCGIVWRTGRDWWYATDWPIGTAFPKAALGLPLRTRRSAVGYVVRQWYYDRHRVVGAHLPPTLGG